MKQLEIQQAKAKDNHNQHIQEGRRALIAAYFDCGRENTTILIAYVLLGPNKAIIHETVEVIFLSENILSEPKTFIRKYFFY